MADDKPAKRHHSEKNGPMIHVAKDGINFDVDLGNMLDNDGPPKEEIEYVHMAAIEQRFGRENETCWGCKHFCKPASAKEADLWILYEFYESVRNKLNNKSVCEQLSKLHGKLIVAPRKKAGMQVLDWSPEMVYTHFNYHLINYRTIQQNNLRTIRNLITIHESRLVRKTPDGKEEPDDRNVKAWTEVVKLQYAIMAMNGDRFE